MNSFDPKYLESLSFRAEHTTCIKTIGEYKGRQDMFTRQTPEEIESLRQAAIVESIESSNRIEGITAPHGRIKDLALRSAAPRNRSEQEIAGYRDALALIHGSAEHMPFSTNIVLQLHSLICRYLPQEGGHWKLADNLIADTHGNGQVRRVRFRPVSAVKTPEFMEGLAGRYSRAVESGKEPLVAIPLAILDFLCIHPFRDGNGRVARLLTLLLLYHSGCRVGRYISLERIFEESKETYYEALERSSQHWHESRHDAFPWMTYFWGALTRACREFEERVAAVRSGRGAKTAQVRAAVARKLGPFAISDVEADCPGVSRDMVRLVLRQLRDEGAIALQGRGRSAKWILRTNLATT